MIQKIRKLFPKNKNKIISIPGDLMTDKEFISFYNKCSSYTMTTPERLYAMYKATEYIANNNIEGDIVECGVWKGGSIMISALTLNKLNCPQKKFYLYDTFKGMNKPSEKDGERAITKWRISEKEQINTWCYASLDEVKKNVFSIGYPEEKFIFIEGEVEKTIPATIPEKISILRLDTDWYESTKHELQHLFPRLSYGGILIIDDYGHWQGARRAVDEYIKEKNIKIYLNRVDTTCRSGVKLI